MSRVIERPTTRTTRCPRSGVNFSVRMSTELKTQSEELYRALGMPLTTAIQVFLKKSLAVGGLPFELKVSPPPIPNMATMTQAEFDSELQKGYDSAMAGNLIDARRAHAELMDRMATWNTSRS
ncbi:MAG: type II toxin-antitoxin system RelB/DinJ family antitoxin [Kiritimatiellae bacterium]|nr:type II toxin-antitoxin system RelB/DinJ family antitoxin [Kiritimatiellia bacterium]MBR3777268.1 type II toxin-antitoxin system RelB/DinJ family antitoxin [Kiritimatiellia bacterium]